PALLKESAPRPFSSVAAQPTAPRRERTGRQTDTTASRSPSAAMRTTTRPGSVPEMRYHTVSWARPQYEDGSLALSVAPTVGPKSDAGSPTCVALARLSFGGGGAAECAAAAV